MKKKTIGILLMISLVMIISISAISAADANETLMEEVSDTDIETISSDIEAEDTAASTISEACGEVEKIIVNDTQNEKTDQKVVKASSSSNEVLAASNDDVLKSSEPFHYKGMPFASLGDAIAVAVLNDGGTIYVEDGTYYTDPETDCNFEISGGKQITITPYNPGGVTFESDDNDYLFIISGENTHITFLDMNFKNGLAEDGGAFEVRSNGKLTLSHCTFTNNRATDYGGAISVKDSGSVIARYCHFAYNWAENDGGAIASEEDGSVKLEYCSFEGNTAGEEGNNHENDFGYEDGIGTPGSWSLTDCRFKGHGSITFKVHDKSKSVTIYVNVDDNIDHLVLFNSNGELVETVDCYKMSEKTFSDLDAGTYTIYTVENIENIGDKRYEYTGNTCPRIS